MLPEEMGCGSGVTCWRRLRYWQRRGVWKKLLHTLLQRVGQEKGIDWERCCVDSQSFRAVFGGPSPAKTPQIGPKKARNGTCSSMARARRWPCAAAENPLRKAASNASGFPFSSAREDLLQGPAEGFLK